jgi:hypothetical protein
MPFKRGTAEQWIKEGKQAVKMTRLSCHRFRSNQVRLALSLLAYNLENLWRRLGLPRGIENWSLTSLQQRLVKTGGRLVKHAYYALMTGRYSIRSGNQTVALAGSHGGLVKWERTMGDIFSEAGYATSIVGKRHIGDSPRTGYTALLHLPATAELFVINSVPQHNPQADPQLAGHRHTRFPQTFLN